MVSNLIPYDEVIKAVAPRTMYAFARVIPKLLFALIAAYGAKKLSFYPAIWLSLFFIVIALYQYFHILSFRFFLTAQQIIITKGVFTTTVNYLELYRVKDLYIHQSLLMKVFRMMNVTLISFDTAEPILKMKGVKVSAIGQEIRNYVQECRQRNKILSIDN